MRFHVSTRFRQRQEIKEKGEELFYKLPPWVTSSGFVDIDVVVGISSEDSLRVKKDLPTERQAKVWEYTFIGREIYNLYTLIFKRCLDIIIKNSLHLRPIFNCYVDELNPDAEGGEKDDIVQALYRHLVWYYLNEGQLRSWSAERHALCREIAEKLSNARRKAYKAIGTLQ